MFSFGKVRQGMAGRERQAVVRLGASGWGSAGLGRSGKVRYVRARCCWARFGMVGPGAVWQARKGKAG